MKEFEHVEDIFVVSEPFKSILKDKEGNLYMKKWIGYTRKLERPLVHYNRFVVYNFTDETLQLYLDKDIDEREMELLSESIYMLTECATTKDVMTVREADKYPEYALSQPKFFNPQNYTNAYLWQMKTT